MAAGARLAPPIKTGGAPRRNLQNSKPQHRRANYMDIMAARPATLAPLLLLLLLGVASRPTEAGIFALPAGDRLSTGQSLTYGKYVFTMQADCNLVLYDDGKAIWESHTADRGDLNCVLVMQRDGNLVVYAPGGKPIWASDTSGAPGNYYLRLQRDRNVVVYSPDGRALWATYTNIPVD